jgi:hypothetical protein
MAIRQLLFLALFLLAAFAAGIAFSVHAQQKGEANGRASTVFVGIFFTGVALLIGMLLIAMMQSAS